MAWLNLTIPNQTIKNGLKVKKIKLTQMNIFLKKLIKFSCTYWPLSFCKILKKFLGPIQSYETYHFWLQNGPFVMNNFFFSKNHCYYFHLPICPFHCAKFKKFLQRIQNYEDAPFLGPKWSICPKQNFFWKVITIILVYLLAPFIVQTF